MCLRVGRPTSQTDRHRLVRERGDKHVRKKHQGDAPSPQLHCSAMRACGEARKVQAPVPWLMGAAMGVRTPIAHFMPRLRETALEARFPSPNSNHDRGERRWKRAFSPSKNNIWLRGTTFKVLVSMRIVRRRRRSAWTLDRGNLC